MARLPTIESVLFGAYRLAGLNTSSANGGRKLGTPQIRRFIAREDISLESHQSLYLHLVEGLLRELGSDNDVEIDRDLLGSLYEFHSLSSELGEKVWTYGASEKQIFWALLSCCYVPWFARKAAFWRHEIELTKDIPGGVFWYLPQPSNANPNILELPIAQVCRWLLKLLGVEHAYRISELEAKDCGSKPDLGHFEDKKEALRRGLYNWLSGEVSISAQSIKTHFADDSELKLEIEDQDGAIITWREIRQRFLYARVIQEAYTELVERLCPGIDYRCADPAQNKVIQLIELYKQIYQWTKDSYTGVQSHFAADQKFIAQVDQHPRAFALNVYDSSNGLADSESTVKRITEILMKNSGTDELEDVEPWDDDSYQRIAASNESLKEAVLGRHADTETLFYHTVHRNAKQAIATSKRPAALLSLLNANRVPWKLKQLALKRLDSLKLNDWDQMHRICVELSLYLNQHAQKTRKETQAKVGKLLEEAAKHPKYRAFEAPILQYQAKHLLSQNRLDDALVLFEQALDACSGNGHGPLKGEIARDLFATSLSNQNLGPKHQKWFRTVFFENTFETERHSRSGRTDLLMQELMNRQPPTFEDTAAQCAEFFWDTLYRPYAGFQPLTPGLTEDEAFKRVVEMIFAEDWQAFRTLIKTSPAFSQKRFRDVRGQTLLIMLINMRHHTTEIIRKAAQFGIQPNLAPEVVLGRLDEALNILVDILPKKSVNIEDYKQQSALMLAANSKLSKLVAQLINKGAMLNQQDFEGRTALHAAAASGSDESFSLLIEAGADPSTAMNEGMNVLHTAVRCGRPRMTKMLLESFPSLASTQDHHDKQPKDYVGINNHKDWARIAKENDREMGSDDDYLEVATIVEKMDEERVFC